MILRNMRDIDMTLDSFKNFILSSIPSLMESVLQAQKLAQQNSLGIEYWNILINRRKHIKNENLTATFFKVNPNYFGVKRFPLSSASNNNNHSSIQDIIEETVSLGSGAGTGAGTGARRSRRMDDRREEHRETQLDNDVEDQDEVHEEGEHNEEIGGKAVSSVPISVKHTPSSSPLKYVYYHYYYYYYLLLLLLHYYYYY